MVQAVPSQCSMSTFGAPPENACHPPTAQQSVACVQETASRLPTEGAGGLGLGTGAQDEPSHCSMSVGSVVACRCKPTAMHICVAGQETPRTVRLVLALVPIGAAAHADPFHRSANGSVLRSPFLSRPALWEPMAMHI